MNQTLKLFLLFIIPLYLSDQVTKFWAIERFEQPYAVDEKGKFILDQEGRKLRYQLEEDQVVRVSGDDILFYRVHNQGVAWGMGNGSKWAPIVFLFVPPVALIAVFFFWKRGVFRKRPARYAAPLIVAGVLGNLTDRLVQGFLLDPVKDESFFTRLSEGYVVDFIAVKIPVVNYDWPVFNIADSCITVAASLLFISAIMEEIEERKSKKGRETSTTSEAE